MTKPGPRELLWDVVQCLVSLAGGRGSPCVTLNCRVLLHMAFHCQFGSNAFKFLVLKHLASPAVGIDPAIRLLYCTNYVAIKALTSPRAVIRGTSRGSVAL